MNKFYIMERVIRHGDIYIHGYKAPDLYEEEYSSGRPLEKTKEPIQLFYKYKTHRKTDYIGGIHLFPVVSRRFKEVLLKLNVGHLEFHPVQLICRKTKEVDTSYSFLNILNNIPCFDWEKSEYETIPTLEDVIIGVEKLVVKQDKLRGRDLTRILEIRSVILVSARLRTLIESAGLTGIQFQRLEDFQFL